MSREGAISVAGLGNLGQPLAICLASRGFEVFGIDVNTTLIESLASGRSTIAEPGVQELLTSTKNHIVASTDHAIAIDQTDVTFVLVATPSETSGRFSLTYLDKVLASLGTRLRESRKPSHLFIVGSTVSPGSAAHVAQVIAEASGRHLNKGFALCYCPELIALGSAVNDFLNPDMVIIGESNPEAGAQVDQIYDRLCVNDPPHIHMSLEEAELAKLSLNCYLTLKISFANTLAQLCESVPGADLDVITGVLQRDRRIGRGYLSGGLPYGGPCFPRDAAAFLEFAGRVGVPAHLVSAAEEVNRAQRDRVAKAVRAEMDLLETDKITVLGIAFKENSAVLAGSVGVDLVETLLTDGAHVTVFDPLANEAAQRALGLRVRYADSLAHAIGASPVSVVMTRAREFTAILPSMFAYSPTAIIDCWRTLDSRKLGPTCRYTALGRTRAEALAPGTRD